MAGKFSFSLQKVLDLRKHHEEQAALDYSKKKAALELEKRVLQNLKNEKQEALDGNQNEQVHIDLNRVMIANDYILGLDGKIAIKKEDVKNKNEIADQSLRELTEKVKKKKIMEKLKEKQYEEHKKKNRLLENKLIDDVAIRNAGRNKGING